MSIIPQRDGPSDSDRGSDILTVFNLAYGLGAQDAKARMANAGLINPEATALMKAEAVVQAISPN